MLVLPAKELRKLGKCRSMGNVLTMAAPGRNASDSALTAFSEIVTNRSLIGSISYPYTIDMTIAAANLDMLD